MATRTPNRRSDSPFEMAASSMLVTPEKPKTPSKSLLRPSGTPGTGSRVGLKLPNASPSPVDTDALTKEFGRTVSTKGFKDPPVDRGEKTPRSSWRAQYWKKSTPWATDRDAYGGRHQYMTTIKPSSQYYNSNHQWHVEGYNQAPSDSALDIVKQLIAKLEQHCRSTFLLTRMFKMFDKDNNSTIDKEEMVAVLLTFSIELTETQLDAIMQHFGAQEVGGEQVISYAQFVSAIESVAKQHPLSSKVSKPGYIRRAIFSTSTDGKRLCTPGFHSPIGCPMHGSYYPEDSSMLKIHNTQTNYNPLNKNPGAVSPVQGIKPLAPTKP
uniref:EF-hand domain-containing protein n=1 Tax=Hemiselmis andersenii TaxID=464988 RepID=A0A6U2F9A4_HEMAN|mmetsp:Transcript_30964/g.72398  ORF Transcript_30964/g.72398 Transcript_30964/m.72398 type:complete len:324 (+) Transcript_30964:218-1189(+)|eukprot:CAMPEP_0114129372 /NCGR_PEP_ID=MMETSP0043_2-20121206/11441_1 /TAXON_ID=464988 /ORGANISM="Hemiselmis andersenii, Strain CCMP644" /LENGTH=323 /DNA_ID=CAMNT_0001222645 /DNA_START=191 /DNA_END=1162 /DNA_ORIENTATION=-